MPDWTTTVTDKVTARVTEKENKVIGLMNHDPNWSFVQERALWLMQGLHQRGACPRT